MKTGRQSLGRKELDAIIIYSKKDMFSYHADFPPLFLLMRIFPRNSVTCCFNGINP